MSARRLGSGKSIPDDATWIEFPRSDGDASLLPTNTERIVDAEGCVNFMRPVLIDEGAAATWRIGIGAHLAKRMGLPEGPKYVLKSFPTGYHMYDHNKGPAAAPRHDLYLCGSRNVNRFRSMNEFIPHAVWLFQDASLNRANCECKYCSKKPQRVVTDILELPTKNRSSATPSSTPNRVPRRHREVRTIKPPPYAAVRRAAKPFKQVTEPGPQQTLTPERDVDIRASHTQGEARRWFRKGELLWCVLDPPIMGPSPEQSIQYWPGLVEDVYVKSEGVKCPGSEGNNGDVDLSNLYVPEPEAESAPSPRQSHEPYVPPAGAENATLPWTVRQWNVYSMKLLAVTHEYVVSDHQLLPYLAQVPSEELLHAIQDELFQFLRTVPIEEMDTNLTKIYPFNPVSAGDSSNHEFVRERFKQAAAPYTLAVQIASHLMRFWGPTDDWECKFVIPPNLAGPAPNAPGSASAPSLHSLISHSMSNNAAADSTRAGARNTPDGVHKPAAMSAADFQTLKSRILGQPAQSADGSLTVSQTRYQGLWWGAERIWTDELVRLKLARRQFAPEGTDSVFPPSGPSDDTKQHAEKVECLADVSEKAMGASEKGLFLQLEGLLVVDVAKSDGSGTKKECRASGTLYELADEEWAEGPVPSGARPATTAGSEGGDSKGKGKGKGKEVVRDNVDPETERASTPQHAVRSSPSISQAGAGPSFMPGPSPLKAPPLSNPDPSVPMEETAAAAISQTVPSQQHSRKERMDDQLSHPILSTPYPLPEPPRGFRFRAIHSPDHEVVLSLSYISGRYYPHLFSHPLMAPVIENARNIPQEAGGLYASRHLWAMQGLLPGIHQAMESSAWKPSRKMMFTEADAEARDHFKALWDQIKYERQQAIDGVRDSPQRREQEIEIIDVDMLPSV
ncbi:uncharacterized protein FIBRA_03873 [Fibroporia radiculosa]|uniref:Cryptic loci regulator 2 N-terminal domain-containing protein n=1 Tax=Fibroporia radiculosa TaxID=599839 RepID=J4I9V2_9APHY|nr:uncharacterized protein FIBRA_03873 [Fibroporia radiculosa]CCM01806.1 predicted protein [Fibroporia radiculosa]